MTCSALRSTGDENMVWQGLGLLQEGLSHSPSNAQFKLLLLLLYCRLGAFEPVVDLYTSLDAKHVQHDTIGSVFYELSVLFRSYEQSPRVNLVTGLHIYNYFVKLIRLKHVNTYSTVQYSIPNI